MKNLFVSTTFLPDSKSLREALEKCKEFGISSVELGSNHKHDRSFDYLHEYKFQYLVHNYFPIPKESFVLNIASTDDMIRYKSLDHIKNAIDLCVEIRADLYTFHPGFLTDPIGSNVSNKNYDFQWDSSRLQNSNYEVAKKNMYESLDEAIKYAQSKNIQIAIESEGSIDKKDHLLMQHPEEYIDLMQKFSPNDLGVNLNIGHLNLSANAFNFDRFEFVDLIENFIIGMELSHNNGLQDEHLPLVDKSWYWDLIKDKRFKETYKILEFRNTHIDDIKSNINLIEKKINAI